MLGIPSFEFYHWGDLNAFVLTLVNAAASDGRDKIYGVGCT